ncbi:MAG TPA: uroporphyrinogen decarboxylase family protein [Vicinamibacterales bacterium]|jgi:hypothetical protein
MTKRERLTRILDRQPVDRLAWTTLADTATLSGMDDRRRGMSILEFYRHIDCDILQQGNHHLPPEAWAQYIRRVQPIETSWSSRDDIVERRMVSPWGELATVWRKSHPIKYTVTSAEELRLLARIWRESHYEPDPGARASERRAIDLVGEDGLYLPTLEPSPVQQLIQTDLGLEQFYYYLEDHPSDMTDLMAEMQRCRLQECEITAALTAAPALMAIENTSSTLTSPRYYRRLSLPHVTEYIDATHRHGKKIVLHMCGLLHHLLPMLAGAGIDAINGLTPPPVGDCGPEEALDVLGEDLVQLGTTLPAFQEPGATRESIWQALDEFYSPRIRRSHMLLWVVADGLPTSIDRFESVREWMERQGGGSPA